MAPSVSSESAETVVLIFQSAILLLAAVLVWGIFGSVSTTYTVKGVASGGSIICYVNANEDIQVDKGMHPPLPPGRTLPSGYV